SQTIDIDRIRFKGGMVMTRRMLLTSVLSLTGLAVLGTLAFVLFPTATSARPEKGRSDEPQAQVTQLPIGQVVLFSSGVGYFQREGQIDGNARVDLAFPVSDINDLIKSMVLRDMDGGHISAVSYDSNAPIERTLKSFAINLTNNPSLAQILTQARGEKVEVARTSAHAGAATLPGPIVGLEP